MVPVHNQEELLSETIHSVLAQTYPNWKLIAVNDGSNDRTLSILSDFSICDERIHVLSTGQSAKGACYARNLGFQHGSSPYVMFLDSDDILAEKCLESRIACFQKNPSLDFVLGTTFLFNERPFDLGMLWNRSTGQAPLDILRFLRQDMPWHTMSPLWRRQSFLRTGGWNETLLAFQDWELHIRACFLNMQYKQSHDEPDCFYRLPSKDRHSIAFSNMTQEKILARQMAIQSVAKLHGFLDSPMRRENVEAFCLRNALQLIDADKRSTAFRFLFNCIHCKLFRPLQALGAIAIMLRGKNWRGSRYARDIQSYLWSSESRVDPWEKVQCSV